MFDCPEKTLEEKLRNNKKNGFIPIDPVTYEEALELWFEFKDKLKKERDTDDKRISKGI